MIRARHRAAPLLAGAVLALATAGCTSSDAPAPTTTEATTTTTEVPLAAPAEVLDAGAEPRQELRLAFRAGDEVVLRVATDLAVEQEVGGRTQRLDSPPIVQLLRLAVTDADAEGATLQLGIDAVTVEGEGTDLTEAQLAELQASVDPLVGVTGTIQLDALGRTTKVDLELPDGLPEAARSPLEALEGQLRQLTPPLPEEAVGAGARWRTTTEATGLAGASIEGQLVQTVTLVGTDDGRVTYDATVEVLADAQELELADGTSGRLVDATVQGRSLGWFSLASPTQQGEARTTGEVALELGEGATTVDQRTSSLVRVAPQAP